MKTTEIEARLATELLNEVPDVLDSILQRCEDRGESACEIIELPKKEKRGNWQKSFYAVAAMFVLLVGGWLGFGQYQAAYGADTLVILDVNPGLALEVNKNETVRSASGINADGRALLAQIAGDGNTLKGKKLDAVMEELIASMAEAGYLNEQSCAVLVTVSGADPEKSAVLSARLMVHISEQLAQKGLDGAVLGQSIAETTEPSGLAEQYGISQGRAELIKKILEKNPRLSFEALARLSVSELGLLADKWVRSKQMENISLIGTLSAKGVVSAEAALDHVLAQANISSGDGAEVDISVGIDEGKLVYDISVKANDREFQYEVDVKSGLILNWNVAAEEGGHQINGQLGVQADGKIGIGREISVGNQSAETAPPSSEEARNKAVNGRHRFDWKNYRESHWLIKTP